MTGSFASRRKLFMHPAHHKTVGIPATLAVREACEPSDFAMGHETVGPLRVCLVSGAPKYNSDQSLTAFEEYLVWHYNAQCSRASCTAEDELPDSENRRLENLESCDCMLLFVQRMTIDGEPLQRIQHYCRHGGAVVGVRTAGHALQHGPELHREVFGGDYRGDYHNDATEVRIVEAAKDHPVLPGVEPFVSRASLYRNPNIAEDTTVLLTGTFSGHTQPVAWTRPHRGGRVFYTSLGHPDDFRKRSFLRLLSGALYWTSGRRA